MDELSAIRHIDECRCEKMFIYPPVVEIIHPDRFRGEFLTNRKGPSLFHENAPKSVLLGT